MSDTPPSGLDTGTGRVLRPGAQIGKGGGGVVYLNAADGATVIKVLKEPNITADNERLLRAMVARGVTPAVPGTTAVVAWPQDIVLDARRRVVGYTMRKALGPQPHILYDLMHPHNRERIAVNLAWHTLLRIAYGAAACIAHLHNQGIVVGDINESNILAGGNGEVTMIDCDSMQFREPGGRRWFTAYHKPEYLAPELHGVDLHKIPRRPEHDRYAMAVLFFQLLMDNWHPYNGVGGDEDAKVYDHARAGRFPYPGDLRDFRPPPGAPPWHALPRPLQGRFIEAFRVGARTPSARPTAIQWAETLRDAAGELRLCGGPRQHYFPRGLPSCPWCERDVRLGRTKPEQLRRPGSSSTVDALFPRHSTPP